MNSGKRGLALLGVAAALALSACSSTEGVPGVPGLQGPANDAVAAPSVSPLAPAPVATPPTPGPSVPPAATAQATQPSQPAASGTAPAPGKATIPDMSDPVAGRAYLDRGTKIAAQVGGFTDPQYVTTAQAASAVQQTNSNVQRSTYTPSKCKDLFLATGYPVSDATALAGVNMSLSNGDSKSVQLVLKKDPQEFVDNASRDQKFSSECASYSVKQPTDYGPPFSATVQMSKVVGDNGPIYTTVMHRQTSMTSTVVSQGNVTMGHLQVSVSSVTTKDESAQNAQLALKILEAIAEGAGS